MAPQFADDDDENPFASPGFDPTEPPQRGKGSIARVKGKVQAPAIGLIIASSIGLLMSIVNIVIAATSPPPVIDPNAPELLQEFQKGQVGPVAVVIQVAFVFVNVIIMIGAIQMFRFQSRGFAIAVSILAILNFGSCCCLLGAPFGIWSLIVLMADNVANAFKVAAEE